MLNQQNMRSSSAIRFLKVFTALLLIHFGLNAQSPEFENCDFTKIDKRATLLEVSLDRFSFLSHINDPEGVFVNYISQRWGIGIEAEFGLDENIYLESGIHFGKYFRGYSILTENKDAPYLSSGTGPNWQVALSTGCGYRFMTKKKSNLFLLSAGISVNSSNNSDGWGSSSSFNSTTNEFIYRVDYVEESKRHIYPSLYANLSKEFEITKNTSVSAHYRYNQGFTKSNVTSYNVEAYGSDIRDVEVIRNGTSWSIGIGFKYNFGERKNAR